MNAAPWYALLALAGIAMLVVPFLPAWSEWRRPTDAAPLSVPPDYSSRVDFFARQARQWADAGAPAEDLLITAPTRFREPLLVRGDVATAPGTAFTALLAMGDVHLGPDSEVSQWIHADGDLTLGEGSVALRRVSAGGTLALGTGSSFERLHAPELVFGGRRGVRARIEPALAALDALPNVTRRTQSLLRAEGDLALPADAHFVGALVVTGALSVGENTVITGDVKARQGIIVGPGAAIEGAVTCEQSIHVHEGAFVRGPLIAEKDVWLAPGVVVGTRDRPTTVTADSIMVGVGVKAYGTVWARDAGVVWDA